MKKILTILFTCTSIFLSAQTCLSGDVTFTTQQEIDDFPTDYPGCIQILGNVTITSETEITNLNGLSAVTSIVGNLLIAGNWDLTSLAGLNALTSVGGFLEFQSTSLTSLTGLNALHSVGGELRITNNPVLTNLTALNALTYIGGTLSIRENAALTSLAGLDNINPASFNNLVITNNSSALTFCGVQSICDFLSEPSNFVTISGNGTGCNDRPEVEASCPAVQCPTGPLTFTAQQQIDDFPANYPGCTVMPYSIAIEGEGIVNLNGLSQLESIGGNLYITGSSISNLVGLGSISSIGGDVSVFQNYLLPNFTGLEALVFIGGYLTVAYNGSLENFSGLDALTTIGSNVDIFNNPALSSLTGLGNLTTIGSYLAIGDNYELISLTELNRLTSINGSLSLFRCAMLPNLSGLENIDIGGITLLELVDNGNLSICDLPNICTYLSNPSNPATISGNATGCATRPQVEAACTPVVVCPAGDLIFTTQQQVDNFSANYPGCTVMPYSITISGAGITNLNGLGQLAAINGSLSISGSSLTNLSGLGALASLGGSFTVSNNAALTTLAGIGPITGVNWLSIGENAALTNLNGLNTVGSVAGNMNITSNPVLTNLTGLSALASIGGDVYIFGNNALTNLSGLNALTGIGGSLNVYSNPSMTNLTGLNALTSVTGGVDILYMTISSLSGLNHLNSIGGNLNISYTAIGNMTGLGSLTHLGGSLTLNYNGLLANVTALAALTTIGGALTISNNGALTSLNGLHNVAAGSITSLVLTNNSLLSVCDMANICTYLSNPSNPATISGNATGCATRPQVETACNAIVYTFTGASGLTGWTVPENWTGNLVPPDPLPVGSEIIIAANCTRTWYTTINGSITINSGVTLTISNAAEDLTFTINGVGHNYGAINANDEDLVIGSGGNFTNYSGASVQATATLGGIGNNGQFTNQSGATVNVFGVGNSGTFTNAGTVTIGFIWTNLAGSTLNNSGNITNSNGDGGLNNVAGAAINISGGIIQLSCGITNNGTIGVSGGDLRLLRNPVTWPTGLTWTGGTVTVGGGFNIGSSLTVTVPASGTLIRINGQPMTISSGGTLVVNGAFTPQSGFFEVQSGGNFNIGSGGTVTFANTSLDNSGTVGNAGTLNLNQANGQFLNNGAFSNSGTVNISRALRNSGTLTNTGTININSNGILELNTNPAELPGSTLNWNSGGTILVGANGGFTLDNLLTVPSGCFFTVQSTQPFTISAGGQLANNGTVSLSNSPSVNNGTITNNSNFTLQSGSLTNNGTLSNAGLFTIRSAFNNHGTLNQTGGNFYFCIPISDLQPGGTFNWSGGTMNLGRPSVCTCTATQNTPYVLPSGRSWSVNASSSLTNGSTITIPQSSSITVFGSLINNRTIQNNGVISPFGGSNFTNNGLITGTGSQQGTVGFTNGPNGTIAPGASPGCYSFLQGFTNQGTLSMELDGPTPCTQYDYLTNSGTTTLGGTLQLTFGFAPFVGQSFTLLFSTSIAGSFSTINVTPNNITVVQSGATITVTGVLPVELVAFSAEKFEKYVQLDWQTASETNNRGFEVQRSDDGARWREIGFVNGHGTTITPQHYDFYDKKPGDGMNYYRLRQIDFDGTANLSHIVAVHSDNKLSELQLNPNPTSAIVEIKGVDLTSKPLLKIIDATGRALLEQRLSSSTLDVSALPPGIYHLVLYDSKGAFQTGRLVRQ